MTKGKKIIIGALGLILIIGGIVLASNVQVSKKDGKVSVKFTTEAKDEASKDASDNGENSADKTSDTNKDSKSSKSSTDKKTSNSSNNSSNGEGLYYDKETGLTMRTKPVGNIGRTFSSLSEYEQWMRDYLYAKRLKKKSGVGDEVWNVTGQGSKLSCDYPKAVTSLATNEYYDPDIYQSTGKLSIKISKGVGTSGKTFSSISAAFAWYDGQMYSQGIKTSSNRDWPWRVTGNLSVYSIDAPVATAWREALGSSGLSFATEKEAEDWVWKSAKEQGLNGYTEAIWPIRPGGGALRWTCDIPK